jgi:hypothetical protein
MKMDRMTSTSVRKHRQVFENNWLQTIPGKSWFVALRMYGPLEAWIDKSWRPSEVELVN